MKILLEKGDKVTLLPTSELIKIFNQRNFFTEKDRQEFAIILGGKCGTITSIEDKYSFDYFHFQPDGNNNTWTVPRESVILDTTITLRKADLTERLVEAAYKLIYECCNNQHSPSIASDRLREIIQKTLSE